MFHTISLQLSFLCQPQFALLSAIFCGRPAPLFLSFSNTTPPLFNQRKRSAKIPKQVVAAYLFIVLHTHRQVRTVALTGNKVTPLFQNTILFYVALPKEVLAKVV
jgi:hypothetical protein